MDFKEFISNFQKWRSENGYPKREECRDIFRQYRDKKDIDNLENNPIFEYILKQEKPAIFLDNLFKKDSELKLLEQKESLEKDVEKGNIEKENILKECYDYIQVNNLIPNFQDISNNNVKKYFNTEDELLTALKDKYQDLSTYILNEDSFDSDYNKNVAKKIKEYKKFVITTAVSNKKVNKNFLNSLKNYCDYNNALLLILPCADVANRRTAVKWQLDPELSEFPIIYNDTFLNENLMISDIKMSAKIINPISGLKHLCREKSIIVSSTKQDLEYIANFIDNQPHAIMTTGAITLGDYSNDKFMSKRTSKLAENDHVTGAVIVEIENNKIFHFRQIQADNLGRIYDLNIIYNPDGTRDFDKDICAVLGDLHIGEEDYSVFRTEYEIVKDLGIKNLVLHDIGSMSSISHWDKNKSITKALKYKKNNLSLEAEANQIANRLEYFVDLSDIYIVRSNHHNFLHRWIENGDYAKDPINLYYSLDIVKAFLEDKDPFEYMLLNKTTLKNLKGKRNKIKFLKKYESKKINKTEISLHGHIGKNGSQGNNKIFNESFSSIVTAHTHTPSIYRGVYTVGTTSRKDLDYTEGLSTWSHTMCLIHSNGTKQLINCIKDKNNKVSWRLS